jgi:hypothetical protein
MCMSESQRRQKEEAREKSIRDSEGVNATGMKHNETRREKEFDTM